MRRFAGAGGCAAGVLALAWASVSAGAVAATVLMVLPRDEQNIESAYREELKKRQVDAHIDVLRFSGRSEDGPGLIEQVRQRRPALVYAWGTTTTLALAGRADAAPDSPFIRDIPIVFTEVTDPVGSGILRSLEPPGRNVTGVSHVAPLVTQINTLRSYRDFRRLGYLTNPGEPNTQLVAQALHRLAPELRFELVERQIPLDVSGQPDAQALPGLIMQMARDKIDLLYIGPSTFLAFTHRERVMRAALQAGLPTFCATESIVRKAGCLFGLFANGSNVGRFAAFKTAQILKEGRAVDQVPAQTLQRFSLLINMSTAKALNLYPPLQLLNAAEVIE